MTTGLTKNELWELLLKAMAELKQTPVTDELIEDAYELLFVARSLENDDADENNFEWLAVAANKLESTIYKFITPEQITEIEAPYRKFRANES